VRRAVVLLAWVLAWVLASATAAAQALVAPQLVGPVEAPYPAGASRRAATVTLSIVVDETGRSTEVRVVTPAGEGFDDAAIEAAQRMTWKPATLDGKPVAAEIKFVYRFVPPPEPAPEPRAAIVGVVRELGTRKPVAYADVEVRRDGAPAGLATADADGEFAVRRLPGGAYTVVVAAPRHARREFPETVKDGEELEVRYLLDAEGQDPYTTVVEGERRQEVERRTADREEATRIPGTRGDALRVIEAFPGVARPVFGAGALVVRGSNPLDTTTYIGGHQLPLLYHFGGITSIVNSDLLDKIDFLPGNFSSRFGRATGGVVDVSFRAPRRDRLGGYVDVSLLDTGFLLEGPVGEGSLAVAARRSYVDLILSAVLPKDAGLSLTTAPRYWDYQAILDYPVAGGRLSFAAIGSSDELELLLDAPAETDPALRGTVGNTTYVQRILATGREPIDERTQLTLSLAQGTTRLSWFVTAGEVDDFRTDANGDGLTNLWTPADQSGRVWVIIRDGRGGESWIEGQR
jgi:TonB family protein